VTVFIFSVRARTQEAADKLAIRKFGVFAETGRTVMCKFWSVK